MPTFDDVDVVARLADHMQYLQPLGWPHDSVLLALPPPAITGAIYPEFGAACRHGLLETLRRTLGRGGGPLPMIDLAVDARPVTEILRAFEEAGVKFIYLQGAADQPGFARAIAFRWAGGLRALSPGIADHHDDFAWLLMNDPRPLVRLPGGAVRTLPGISAPASEKTVLAALGQADDPLELSADPRIRPYALDPMRLLGPWTGLFPPEALYGTELGATVRERWISYWKTRGLAETLRHALFGIDPALEQRLGPSQRTLRCTSPRIFVIAGIDGAGKTTQALNVVSHLGRLGVPSTVRTLYRRGTFLDVANGFAARVTRGGPLANVRLTRIAKLVDSIRAYEQDVEPAIRDSTVVVMDRYDESHVAAARSQLAWDLSTHPILQELPRPARTFYLKLPVDDALARLGARGCTLDDDEHEAALRGYARVFDSELHPAPDTTVLDASAPAPQITERIGGEILRIIRHDTSFAVPPDDPVVFANRPDRTTREGRCRTVIGDVAGLRELGDDVLRLRARLRRRAGTNIERIPEAFWIDAYASQLVIDALTIADPEVALILWPGAFRRLPEASDLIVLDEVTQLLTQVTDIVGYRPGENNGVDRVLRALGASEAAVSRLAPAYLRSLDACARENGWRRLS